MQFITDTPAQLDFYTHFPENILTFRHLRSHRIVFLEAKFLHLTDVMYFIMVKPKQPTQLKMRKLSEGIEMKHLVSQLKMVKRYFNNITTSQSCDILKVFRRKI